MNLPYFVKQLEDGRFCYSVDSSMLTSYGKCPTLFRYLYVDMQRRKGMPAAMTIGGWWSRVLELFYLNMQSRQQANAGYVTRDELCAFAVDAWNQCTSCKHQHHLGAETCNRLIGTATTTQGVICPCTENRNMSKLQIYQPKAFDAFGGAKGALAMAMEYYDRVGAIDNSNLKIVASEAGFGLKGELTLYDGPEFVIHYVGKPDLVVYDKAVGFLAPLDHKTVDRVRSDIQRKYKPHGQTTGYIWAIGQLAASLGYSNLPVDRCIINISARLAPAEKPRDGKPKPRFTRVFPNYSPDEVEEWRLSTIEKVRRLHFSITNNSWTMEDNACHLYGGCDFRLLDSVAPANRPTLLKSDYVTVEPWVPYSVEDDENAD